MRSVSISEGQALGFLVLKNEKPAGHLQFGEAVAITEYRRRRPGEARSYKMGSSSGAGN